MEEYSKRQNKVSRLIQKELSDIFQKEGLTLFSGALVTVTVVRISKDLSFAKVFVSIFDPKNNKDEVYKTIKLNTVNIRHNLSQRIKSQMRGVPELSFEIDDSLDYQEDITNRLK